MNVKIVYPINAPLYGDNFKDAVKNFVKLNYNMGLASMLVADQDKRFQVNLRYYTEDIRNRVGFDVVPVDNSVVRLNMPIMVSTNINDYTFWNPYGHNNMMGIPFVQGLPFFP